MPRRSSNALRQRTKHGKDLTLECCSILPTGRMPKIGHDHLAEVVRLSPSPVFILLLDVVKVAEGVADPSDGREKRLLCDSNF